MHQAKDDQVGSHGIMPITTDLLVISALFYISSVRSERSRLLGSLRKIRDDSKSKVDGKKKLYSNGVLLNDMPSEISSLHIFDISRSQRHNVAFNKPWRYSNRNTSISTCVEC